jgi:hypothetical protein
MFGPGPVDLLDSNSFCRFNFFNCLIDIDSFLVISIVKLKILQQIKQKIKPFFLKQLLY